MLLQSLNSVLLSSLTPSRPSKRPLNLSSVGMGSPRQPLDPHQLPTDGHSPANGHAARAGGFASSQLGLYTAAQPQPSSSRPPAAHQSRAIPSDTEPQSGLHSSNQALPAKHRSPSGQQYIPYRATHSTSHVPSTCPSPASESQIHAGEQQPVAAVSNSNYDMLDDATSPGHESPPAYISPSYQDPPIIGDLLERTEVKGLPASPIPFPDQFRVADKNMTRWPCRS